MGTECKTSQLNGASDSSASETSEEPDHQDIAPNSPTDESRPKQCKTVLKVKVCASCKTKKTPLWRDAEDGMPLLQCMWYSLQEVPYLLPHMLIHST